jgi:hypothetical protein
MGPSGISRHFLRALVDSGSDDTLFPLDAAGLIEVSFKPQRGHSIVWRGQRYALEFGDVQLALFDGTSI